MLAIWSRNTCWETICNVLGVKERHGLLSNSFTGAHQHYLFLCLENNLVPFNYNVVLWSREGAWGKRGTGVEFSTFSVCVCINTQKKDTINQEKQPQRNMYSKAYLIYLGFINMNVCSASTDLRYDKAQSPSSAKPLFTPINFLLFSDLADISKWVLVGLIIFILWELYCWIKGLCPKA